jgi:anti-anti-sigma factor
MLDGHTEIVLDLSQVTFLDSTGVHELLRARTMAGIFDRRLVLAEPNAAVRRVMALAGIFDLFEVSDSLAG